MTERKPVYAIVADGESSVAQHGQAALIKYESDYYGNYVQVASGRFHDMSDLAKRLNDAAAEDKITVRANPELPPIARLAEIYRLSSGASAPAHSAGLAAIWRDGCDAGMTAS